MPNSTPAEQHLVSLEEAEDILSPYRDRLNRCIQHGWDVWKTEYLHKHHILGPRARATIVFDEIVFRAVQEFASDADLRTKRTPSSFMLYIGDRITLRFKKIRRNGRCSNIKTHQQVLFLAQARCGFQRCWKARSFMPGILSMNRSRRSSGKASFANWITVSCGRFPLSGDNAALVQFVPEPLRPTGTNSGAARFEAKPELVVDIPRVKAIAEEE